MPDDIVQCRIDSRVKDKANRIFKKEGQTMSGAIRLFLKRAASERKIPFDVEISNKVTIKAMQEARSGKGITPVTLDQLRKEWEKAAETKGFSSKKKQKKILKRHLKRPFKKLMQVKTLLNSIAPMN